jgi:hypothetical protein
MLSMDSYVQYCMYGDLQQRNCQTEFKIKDPLFKVQSLCELSLYGTKFIRDKVHTVRFKVIKPINRYCKQPTLYIVAQELRLQKRHRNMHSLHHANGIKKYGFEAVFETCINRRSNISSRIGHPLTV